MEKKKEKKRGKVMGKARCDSGGSLQFITMPKESHTENG